MLLRYTLKPLSDFLLVLINPSIHSSGTKDPVVELGSILETPVEYKVSDVLIYRMVHAPHVVGYISSNKWGGRLYSHKKHLSVQVLDYLLGFPPK